MKRLFHAALALVLLAASCTKTRVSVQVETGDAKEAPPPPDVGGLGREAAVSIAKDDAAKTYALKAEQYNVNAFAQDGEWKVIFDRKNRPPLSSGGVIEYRINRKTGEIVDKGVYQ